MKRSFAVLVALAAAVVVLYRKGVRLYWTYDDPWFLHVALMRRWTEGFTHADIWRQNTFTPLLTSTYELFVATLWLEPRRWYAAQLVLLVVLAFAVYAALRLYIDTIPAAGGALLFVIGPPLVNAATNIGTIHYLEALLFVTLAFIAFARERDILSGLLYFVAILAKEIAVPLPALLLLLARERRVRRVVPHAVALAVYTAWRLIVIGRPVTGYGWSVGAWDVARVPLSSLALFGPAGITLLVLMAVVIAQALRTRRSLLIGAAGLLLAVGPILPVSREMQPRFLLLPWLWTCAGFAVGAASLRWRNPAIGVVLVAGLLVNRQEWTHQYTHAKRMSEEAYVWVHEKGDVLLRNPAILPGTMPELQWLKEDYFPHAKGARWFYDDIYLCTHPIEGRRILEFNPASRRVEEVKIDARRFCSSIRDRAPLSADFEYRDGSMQWHFGPYREGKWRLILYDGEHVFDVPDQAAYRLGTMKQLSLRVGFRAPEGWVTYSPEIALDFTRQSRLSWRR